MVRTNQGGSVLSFVVIGAVMICLFIGGAYIIHQQATQSSEVTPQPIKTPAKQPQTKPSQGTDTQSKPAVPKPTTLPAANQPSVPQRVSPSTETNQLPRTGPASILGSLFAVGLLSGTVIAYVRSRRLQLIL